MMLLLCQQTLQIKPAVWDQTPTANPGTRHRNQRSWLNRQQPLAVHEHGVADTGWGRCREGQGCLATSNLQSAHVDTHVIFCCPITTDSRNSCTHRKAKACGMIVLNLGCCQVHLGVFKKSQSPSHAPEQ